jgi:hypothetical protein
MADRERELLKLERMTPDQTEYVNFCEGGGGEVCMVYNVYVLFEIPLYGGAPEYAGTYHRDELDKLVGLVYSWT